MAKERNRPRGRDATTGALLWGSDVIHAEPPGKGRVDSQHSMFILSGELVIVANSAGLSIGRLLGSGVRVVARVPQSGRAGRTLDGPVLAGGRLFHRQPDADPRAGLLPALGAGGNLTCLDLRAAR